MNTTTECSCGVKNKRPFIIAISGTPGSGKTTLARSLCSELRTQGLFKTVEYVDEYARQYIAKYGPITEMWEQQRILKKQVRKEEVFFNSCECIVTDSPIFLGFMYSAHLVRPGNEKDSMLMADVMKDMLKYNYGGRYDMIFHIDLTLKPVADGIRHESQFKDEWRQQNNQLIESVFTVFPQKRFIPLIFSQTALKADEDLGSSVLKERLEVTTKLVREELEYRARYSSR